MPVMCITLTDTGKWWNNMNYYIGINGIENSSQVKDIADFVGGIENGKNFKIFVSNDTLEFGSLFDQKSLQITKDVFEESEKYPDLDFVLHYTFKHSTEPLEDLKLIKEKLQFVKNIQLDDLKKNQIEALKYLVKDYFVIFPLSDDDFDDLLGNDEFLNIIKNHNFPILLDNSCGRGIREAAEKYKEKITKLLSLGINNIALAGGFGPDYLDTYFEMTDLFKMNVSIDAASKLYSDNVFDVEKAKKYVGNVIAHKYDYI